MSSPENRQQDTNEEAPWLPPDIDLTKPSVARAYDYLLGGKNNFEVDREVVDSIAKVWPGVVPLAKHNREFLRRAIRYVIAEGEIKQIIDIGSGLPTQGNVHEIAHEVDPSVRVVYVDNDPLVLAHARALLAEDAKTVAAIVADVRNPTAVLDDPATRQMIDFEKPMIVIMGGILHHIPDEDDPVAITKAFKDRMPSGSYLIVSNVIDDGERGHKDAQRAVMEDLGSGFFRTWDQQRAYFDGLEMVDPGFVYCNDWRPDERTERDSPWHTFLCAGLARKP